MNLVYWDAKIIPMTSYHVIKDSYSPYYYNLMEENSKKKTLCTQSVHRCIKNI